jgi:hypothetical protein
MLKQEAAKRARTTKHNSGSEPDFWQFLWIYFQNQGSDPGFQQFDTLKKL